MASWNEALSGLTPWPAAPAAGEYVVFRTAYSATANEFWVFRQSIGTVPEQGGNSDVLYHVDASTGVVTSLGVITNSANYTHSGFSYSSANDALLACVNYNFQPGIFPGNMRFGRLYEKADPRVAGGWSQVFQVGWNGVDRCGIGGCAGYSQANDRFWVGGMEEGGGGVRHSFMVCGDRGDTETVGYTSLPTEVSYSSTEAITWGHVDGAAPDEWPEGMYFVLRGTNIHQLSHDLDESGVGQTYGSATPGSPGANPTFLPCAWSRSVPGVMAMAHYSVAANVSVIYYADLNGITTAPGAALTVATRAFPLAVGNFGDTAPGAAACWWVTEAGQVLYAPNRTTTPALATADNTLTAALGGAEVIGTMHYPGPGGGMPAVLTDDGRVFVLGDVPTDGPPGEDYVPRPTCGEGMRYARMYHTGSGGPVGFISDSIDITADSSLSASFGPENLQRFDAVGLGSEWRTDQAVSYIEWDTGDGNEQTVSWVQLSGITGMEFQGRLDVITGDNRLNFEAVLSYGLNGGAGDDTTLGQLYYSRDTGDLWARFDPVEDVRYLRVTFYSTAPDNPQGYLGIRRAAWDEDAGFIVQPTRQSPVTMVPQSDVFDNRNGSITTRTRKSLVRQSFEFQLQGHSTEAQRQDFGIGNTAQDLLLVGEVTNNIWSEIIGSGGGEIALDPYAPIYIAPETCSQGPSSGSRHVESPRFAYISAEAEHVLEPDTQHPLRIYRVEFTQVPKE